MELQPVSVLKEECGKTTGEIREFFQGFVDQGVIEAFTVEFDHETLLGEDKNDKIVKIAKGASLISCFELESYLKELIIVDPETKTRYFLKFESYGGEIDEEGDQTIYYRSALERIADNLNISDIKKSGPDDEPRVPKEFIVACLKVSYNQEDVGESRGSFEIKDVEGEIDPLFEKVHKFVMGK